MSKLEQKCLYQTSFRTYDGRCFSDDTIILFHGGGNFGDLWTQYREYRNEIISRHPNNKILIMPQSVSYQSESALKEDVQVYKKCKNLTICTRDTRSYDILKQHFHNEILLIPDMAFCMNIEKNVDNGCNNILFIKRKDKEFAQNSTYASVPLEAEIREWPTFEKLTIPHKIAGKTNALLYYLHYPLGKSRCFHLIDKIWQRFVLPYNIETGINFINQYKFIYSTRLHGAILAILLGKEVYLLDNSYGKISSFYDTWLYDLDTAHFIG